MITKSELQHGAYYEGECRNASVARWNAVTSRFIYRRYKHGTHFWEDIRHPEDDDGYDLFVPSAETTQPEWGEIPLKA